jgi:hypothetical protein
MQRMSAVAGFTPRNDKAAKGFVFCPAAGVFFYVKQYRQHSCTWIHYLSA